MFELDICTEVEPVYKCRYTVYLDYPSTEVRRFVGQIFPRCSGVSYQAVCRADRVELVYADGVRKVIKDRYKALPNV
jgi:hypothetical protein